MQFGVQFFPNFAPKDKDAATYFAECLAIAEEADALGFSHARSVEHYFERYGGYSPNPIVFLSAVAARTKKMRMVTGAVVPVFNNPLKLAGEIAMLDAIAQGRCDIGFARAFLPHEFRRFDISPDESIARFREGLEQVELLLTQENVSHKGRFHSFENLTSLPRPTQKPRPKFYIASTRTPNSFEYAGAAGLFADVDPDRAAEGPAAGLPQGLARRRTPRRRRGDDRVSHVLPRRRRQGAAKSRARSSRTISRRCSNPRANGPRARRRRTTRAMTTRSAG